MSDKDKKPRLEEGPALYMESLLALREYEFYSRGYSTYNSHKPRELSEFKEGEFKCRWRMGLSLTEEEIKNIIDNLSRIKKQAGLI